MTRRQRAIAFFVSLCVLLVAAAVALIVFWVLTTATAESTSVALVVAGIVIVALVIAGLIVYTVFLVLEIRRNEEHDSFINLVTHELKTPIASIRLYLETLQSRTVSDAQRRHFYDIMLADADRLHQTVDQVLKAGMAREKPRLSGVPLDIVSLARECVQLAVVRHHLRPDAIGFEAPSSDALMVRGDPDELKTLVTNLLNNAVKYSGQHVQVAVSVAAAAPDVVWVRVQDQGMGIPKKQLRRIFRRFYRAPMRGAKPVSGTGLGLYIVRTIARAHGGRVFAQSEGEGRGATFTVELPRLAAQAEALRPGA